MSVALASGESRQIDNRVSEIWTANVRKRDEEKKKYNAILPASTKK
jgi:hypothetical protein